MDDLSKQIKGFDVEPSFWYQTIRLGSHVTPGRTNPEEKWAKLIKPNLPFPVKGKSVLDVGCNAGAFCLKCVDEGAAKITGVEIDNIFRAQAVLVRNTCKVVDDKYGRIRIVKALDDTTGTFDLAFIFNVLYWVGWNTQLDQDNPETPPADGSKSLFGFLKRVSHIARTAYVIGSNQQYTKRKRLGQFTGGTTLEENVKYIEKDWTISKAYEDNSYKRNHCIIHARSKNL